MERKKAKRYSLHLSVNCRTEEKFALDVGMTSIIKQNIDLRKEIKMKKRKARGERPSGAF